MTTQVVDPTASFHGIAPALLFLVLSLRRGRCFLLPLLPRVHQRLQLRLACRCVCFQLLKVRRQREDLFRHALAIHLHQETWQVQG